MTEKGLNQEELEEVNQSIQEVKEAGHGEVVIKIKNKAVQRILATKDKLMVKTTK